MLERCHNLSLVICSFFHSLFNGYMDPRGALCPYRAHCIHVLLDVCLWKNPPRQLQLTGGVWQIIAHLISLPSYSTLQPSSAQSMIGLSSTRNYPENYNIFPKSDPGVAEHNNLTALTAKEAQIRFNIFSFVLWTSPPPGRRLAAILICGLCSICPSLMPHHPRRDEAAARRPRRPTTI